MSNLTESARSRWTEIKQETREGANTATRVGDAGLLILEALDTLDTLKAPLESPVFHGSLKLFYGDEEEDIFLIKKADDSTPLVSITPQNVAIGEGMSTISIGDSAYSINLGYKAYDISIGDEASYVRIGGNIVINETVNHIFIGINSNHINIGEETNEFYLGSFAEELRLGDSAIHVFLANNSDFVYLGSYAYKFHLGNEASEIYLGDEANLLYINAKSTKLLSPTETDATSTKNYKIYIKREDNTLAVMTKSDFLTWLNS